MEMMVDDNLFINWSAMFDCKCEERKPDRLANKDVQVYLPLIILIDFIIIIKLIN